MAIEKSAGAVVFRRGPNGEIEYLLLWRKEGDWNFPKGLIEPDEKPEETARREVREETGLKKPEFVAGFKAVDRYFFKVKYPYQIERGFKLGETVLKFVTFFLVQVKTKKVKVSDEHKGFGWFTFQEALEKLKGYKGSQTVLRKAHEFLSAGPTVRNFSLVQDN